ncbi:ImcF-related family protein [Aquicoccus sp. G2-2]|uniref:ImcF-related family protein n=1 Tax=Aquicoccus sp. G2-2 TaxID=3092120 RepID=UPI002AE04B87|nr:ImcF-related family protein [Aquicoccus sp. G2-2]MEA1114676.1 ImcF-related family protein [Aquicoccus sp. G2-2]
MARAMVSNPYTRAARPVFAMLETIEREARGGEHRLAETAKRLLDQFETNARRGGAPQATLKPARYALALLIDRRARQVKRLKLSTWGVLAGRELFETREITQERLREFRATARAQGREFDDLAAFLEEVEARINTLRKGPKAERTGNWGLWIAACMGALILALGGYATWIEYRFQHHLSAAFEAQVQQMDLNGNLDGRELIARLDQLAEARAQLKRAVAKAPFKRAFRLPFVDSETRADRLYSSEIAEVLPRAVGDAIEQAIATEGESLALYDALRAWAVMRGDVNWQPGYVVGWLEDHEDALGLTGLARHAAALKGPDEELLARDPVLMEQARHFAAEADEPQRAWLELLRAEGARALPRWNPDVEVPGLEGVVLRRSGKPVSDGVAGIYTRAGWAYARDFGVGTAVQTARDMAPKITESALKQVNASPDLVLDRLNAMTVSTWKAWLADLRVRPFARRQTAIEVSGKLALPDNPLTELLREVWIESGGTDRQRSHAQQLLLAREFGPTIQYVEQGRMTEISRLFSTLNVALGSIDINAERGSQRLMTWQDRSRSIQALKAAPLIVVQIAEDVLAQSASAQAEEGSNALTRQWQQLVYPACRATIEGRYPFGDGSDADIADVARLLGPQGQLIVFARAAVVPLLETDVTPWRWKPEARFSGMKPESAAFFERAFAVSAALFGENGQIGMELTLTALAERGETTFAIGGVAEPVRTQGEPARLFWPGPEPARGWMLPFAMALTAHAFCTRVSGDLCG